MRRGVRWAGWAALASCVAGVSTLLAATTPKPTDVALVNDAAAAEPAPAGAKPAEKPPTLLDVALLSAERWAIARMRSENDNLTWQGGQLASLTRLLARAGRHDDALALIRTLDTPERVKVEAYAPVVAGYLRAGDKARAAALTEKVSGIEEWTTSGTLADVARAMDAAGDRAGAVKLAATIPGGLDRAEMLFGMHRYTEALAAAREIEPGSFHIPCGGDEHCWVEDWDPRQSYIVKLVEAFVDDGDLRGAHAAVAALDEVEGFGAKGWKAKALVEIARREEPVATLRQALEELESSPIMLPRDYQAHAETLAQIARGLAAAGQRTQAIGLMPRAMAALGPTDSVEGMEIAASLGCEGLTHIAAVHFDIGQRDEALALLARAERLANEIVVPPPETSDGSSWDSTAPPSTHGSRRESASPPRWRPPARWSGPRRSSPRRGPSLPPSRAPTGASTAGARWWRPTARSGRLDRAMELLTVGPARRPRPLAGHRRNRPTRTCSPRREPQIWGLVDALPPARAEGGPRGPARNAARRRKASRPACHGSSPRRSSPPSPPWRRSARRTGN